MSEEVVSLSLKYGRDGVCILDLPERQLFLHHPGPVAVPNARDVIAESFLHPIEFPALERMFVPGDRVAVVIETDTPQAAQIVAVLWRHIEAAGLNAEDILLLQPATWKNVAAMDPRSALPTDVRDKMQLHRHDPTVEGACAYLASTASNERVYMARAVIDADVVITIGPGQFDPLLGFRGGASALYPGMSDLEAIQRTQGQGHEELGPDEQRPLRQIVDEIGWLLGLQLSIIVVPATNGQAHQVFTGQADPVLTEAKHALRSNWYVRSNERAELVLVTVPEDAGGHGWEQVAAAIDVGRRLVERNGRIVVLSQLQTAPGPGLEILKSVREPRDAIKPIQKAHAPDQLTAIRIAAATDWANVSLLSKLDPNLVSDLFMLSLENENEVRRLLENEDLTAIIEGAQYAFVQSGV